MAILEVLTFPNPILRRKSQPVEKVGEDLKKFTQDMLDTMYNQRGIGLAAPQVGRLERVIVIDTRPRDESRYEDEDQTELEKNISQPLILINPEVIEKLTPRAA